MLISCKYKLFEFSLCLLYSNLTITDCFYAWYFFYILFFAQDMRFFVTLLCVIPACDTA